MFRSIEDTLEIGWKLLAPFPADALSRIPAAVLEARRKEAP